MAGGHHIDPIRVPLFAFDVTRTKKTYKLAGNYKSNIIPIAAELVKYCLRATFL